MASYRKKAEEKERHPGHNHPIKEKCGEHCPRNEHYKGPVKKLGLFQRRK